MTSGHGGGDDNHRYYDLLGVARDAAVDEIERAYRRAAIAHHPDKGGDPEAFKAAAQAYQVLSDPVLRAVYDERGEVGVEEDLAGDDGGYDEAAFLEVVELFKRMMAECAGDEAFDEVVAMFQSMMMGGDDAGDGDRRPPGTVVHCLDVNLEDLYNGATKWFTRNRDVRCSDCNGTGSKVAAPAACTACGGAGYKVAAPRSVMGRFRRKPASERCAACNGSGEDHGAVIGKSSSSSRCPTCHGGKTVTDKKVLKVVVEKGTPDGHEITLAGDGEANEASPGVFGDVVMVVKQREHAEFTRNGDDLVREHELTLAEALCGFRFVMTHLDGRRLIVKSSPGELVRPGQVKAIDGEGMPVHGRPFATGTLYVVFRVAFPDTVTPALRAALSTGIALHGGDAGGGCEETRMRDVDGEEAAAAVVVRGKTDERPARREHGDDEYVHVHPGGDCAQQ